MNIYNSTVFFITFLYRNSTGEVTRKRMHWSSVYLLKKNVITLNITFFYKHKIFHFWIFFLYLYYFLSCGTWFQDSEWEKKSFYLIKLPKWKNVRNPRLSAWPKKLEVGHLLSPTQSINPKNPGLICLTGNKLFIKLYHWLGCST